MAKTKKAPRPRTRAFTELVPPCQKCGHRWGALMIQFAEGAETLPLGLACAHCGAFADPELSEVTSAAEVPHG